MGKLIPSDHPKFDELMGQMRGVSKRLGRLAIESEEVGVSFSVFMGGVCFFLATSSAHQDEPDLSLQEMKEGMDFYFKLARDAMGAKGDS